MYTYIKTVNKYNQKTKKNASKKSMGKIPKSF